MTITNRELANVAVDIIGVVTAWHISHTFYNLTRIRFEDRTFYLTYFGFSTFAYCLGIKMIYKYY